MDADAFAIGHGEGVVEIGTFPDHGSNSADKGRRNIVHDSGDGRNWCVQYLGAVVMKVDRGWIGK